MSNSKKSINSQENTEMFAVLGMHFKYEAHNEKYTFSNIITHASYTNNINYQSYDIAIIKLTKQIQFSTRIKPICLPDEHDDFTYKKAILVGWVITDNNEQNKDDFALQKAEVIIQVMQFCHAALPTMYGMTDSNLLCAYDRTKHSCYGDNGGGMYILKDGIYILAGIINYQHDCSDVKNYNYPTLYTNVTAFRSWIVKNL